MCKKRYKSKIIVLMMMKKYVMTKLTLTLSYRSWSSKCFLVTLLVINLLVCVWVDTRKRSVSALVCVFQCVGRCGSTHTHTHTILQYAR